MRADELAETLAILDRLIAFDTVSASSNLALIDYVESHLRDRGFALRRLPDPTGQKAGLYARLGPAGDGLLLSAHSDVVPTEAQGWSRDPFRLTREDDRLHGRGTTDMKGFLASMLALADRAGKADLKEPLKLAVSYDEEVGCLGIARMIGALPEFLGTPRAAIVGEPTEMTVAIGHKGKVGLRAIARGEAGHSSLAPKLENALYVAADFMGRLRELQNWHAEFGARDSGYEISHTTIHVGKMAGGTALNIVPDRAEMQFEVRYLPDDDPEVILGKISAMAGRGIDLEQTVAYPGLQTSPTARVTRMACSLAATNTTIKVDFGTEAGFFDGSGIPTVVCGPGSMEGQGHKPDEFVTVDQMVACHAMMDRILMKLTGGDGSMA
ncbi:MAG: acetylornithine deacetylase [Boseongicola sp. SB0677_bin_26]|nr:acetylornithine deacetylase [Boseongicola sp. SB0665_bin_10]MYG28241.1 acetylornithine deacetylase [Boseongicola sp. SB0677_bin_26]